MWKFRKMHIKNVKKNMKITYPIQRFHIVQSILSFQCGASRIKGHKTATCRAS